MVSRIAIVIMKGNVPVLQYHNEVLICTLITGHGIVISKERSIINEVDTSSVQTKGCHLRIFIIVPAGISHPLFISFLLSKPWSSSKTKYDG